MASQKYAVDPSYLSCAENCRIFYFYRLAAEISTLSFHKSLKTCFFNLILFQTCITQKDVHNQCDYDFNSVMIPGCISVLMSILLRLIL